MISLNSVRPFCWFHTYYLITTRFRINNAKISRVIILLSNRTLSALKCPVYKGFQKIFIIQTLQQDPFLKQFCLEDMYSCSSDYLWYPYYPEYHSYCYQNVISRDNKRPTPADNIKWLGCIIASRGVNLNIRFDPDERLS